MPESSAISALQACSPRFCQIDPVILVLLKLGLSANSLFVENVSQSLNTAGLFFPATDDREHGRQLQLWELMPRTFSPALLTSTHLPKAQLCSPSLCL